MEFTWKQLEELLKDFSVFLTDNGQVIVPEDGSLIGTEYEEYTGELIKGFLDGLADALTP